MDSNSMGFMAGVMMVRIRNRRRREMLLRDPGPNAHPEKIARHQAAVRAHAAAESEREIHQEARDAETLTQAKPFLDAAQEKRERRSAKRLAATTKDKAE